jgi:hypothetical protein
MGFPHTNYGWDFTMQHARLRVADGAAQSVLAQCFMGFCSCPSLGHSPIVYAAGDVKDEGLVHL